MKILLGSQSPRRKEILSFFKIDFIQATSDFDEDQVPFQNNPSEFVKILSKGKADTLSFRYPNLPILTADTIVYREGKIFQKPKNRQEAAESLTELSGKWHSVFTGLTLNFKGIDYQGFDETKVLFNSISHNQLECYLNSLPYHDKAGGYMIQGAGSIIVNKIEGCYYNVMGLPIHLLNNLLQNIGIDLWHYLK